MSTKSARSHRKSATEISAEIISKLDIIAEYKLLGVQFTTDAPRSSGRIECYAAFREESRPSAYVDTLAGRYGDSGSGEKEISLWEFAARKGVFATWQLARDHYAEKAGVKKSGSRKTNDGRKSSEDWRTALRFDEWDGSLKAEANRRLLAHWCRAHKPGISPDAVVAAGGKLAAYPCDRKVADGTPIEPRHRVVAVPVFGSKLLAAEPVAWVVWSLNPKGNPLTRFVKTTGEHEPIKMKTIGVADGIIGRHGLGLLAANQIDAEANPIDVVWKVEGPTDLLALWSTMPAEVRERTPVLSFAGGSKQANPWMAEPFAGHAVNVIHDADEPGQAGAEKSCELIVKRAASVSLLRLPYDISPKAGKDLRDFINVGGGWGDVDSLAAWADPWPLANATPNESAGPAKESADDDEPIEADDDPHRLARVYVERYATHAGQPTLRNWREEWWRWNGLHYQIVRDSAMAKSLNAAIKEEFDKQNIAAQREHQENSGEGDPPTVLKVSCNLVTNVTAALAGQHTLPDSIDAPFWIDGGADRPKPENLLVTGSGIIDVPALAVGAPGCVLPLTPDFFSPNAVQYRFPNDDPTKCPEPKRWLSFLDSLWGGDEASISLLQEWMGYCLLPDTSQQKIMLLIGPPRSGKGTIARVLTELVGELNVVNPRLSSFGTEFGIEPLVGKTLGIVSDARLSGRADQAQILETILSISGEDKQTVRRMYKSHISTRLRLRFMIVSNELPKLEDSSGAFLQRCLLLETQQSFKGREDKRLEFALRDELPSILIWALQGLARLRDRGSFEQSPAGKEMLAELRLLTSPIKAFFDDCCEIGDERQCNVDDAYEAYREWSQEQGRKPAAKNIFGRDIRAAIPNIQTRQLWGESRHRVFLGFSIRSQFS